MTKLHTHPRGTRDGWFDCRFDHAAPAQWTGQSLSTAANSTANDFFEELLRLPVASSIETPDDQGSTSPDPLANLTTDPQSQVSDNDTTSEDQADKDDSETKDAAAPPIVAGCYAPWAYTGVVPEGRCSRQCSRDASSRFARH